MTVPESDLPVYTLTEAGWPRPRYDGWPIPWVSPREKLAEMNEGRRLASLSGAICNVCGEDFEWGTKAYAFTSLSHGGESTAKLPIAYDTYLTELPGMHPATRVQVLDGAIMHHRCAKLSAAMCPHIKNRAELICIEVPANDADVVMDEEDDKLISVYPAGDVRYVAWPTQR